MPNPPSIDLLKANHSFPGPYTFKIILENRPGLLDEVMKLLELAVQRALSGNKTSRESSGGKHVSLNLELVVLSPEEVHVLYIAMHQLPGVVLIF